MTMAISRWTATQRLTGDWLQDGSKVKLDPYSGFIYAHEKIRGRWIDAESTIAKHKEAAQDYIRYILDNKPWKLAEPTFVKDPVMAYWYASSILKSRWRKAEPFIMMSPQHIYYYAVEVMQERWKEAEPFLFIDSDYTYLYARDLLTHRDVTFEKTIFKSSFVNQYIKQHRKDVGNFV